MLIRSHARLLFITESSIAVAVSQQRLVAASTLDGGRHIVQLSNRKSLAAVAEIVPRRPGYDAFNAHLQHIAHLKQLCLCCVVLPRQ